MSPEPVHPTPPAPARPWDKDYENAGFSPVYEPLWHMLRSFLGSTAAHTVLDFGCGDGAYASLMDEEGLRVTGIDISGAAIRKAMTRRCARCSFERSDSIPGDLPRSSFDAVVMLNSLHCLTRVRRSELFGEVRRVLRPDGHFFASVLSLEDESYPRWAWQEIGRGTFVDDAGRLFHFFSAAELKEELSWLHIGEVRTLQNIHPEYGRKSAIFVVTGQYPGNPRG